MGGLKTVDAVAVNGTRVKFGPSPASGHGKHHGSRPSSSSPAEETLCGDGASTPEAGQAKPSRKAPQKPVQPEYPLFSHLPDATEESCREFQVISDCLYGSKNMGSTDNDALDCDCREDLREFFFSSLPLFLSFSVPLLAHSPSTTTPVPH